MGKIVIKITLLIAFFIIDNLSAQNEACKVIHYYRESFDTISATEIWYDSKGSYKNYVYMNEVKGKTITRSDSIPANWKTDSIIQFPIRKITIDYNNKRGIIRNYLDEHFSYALSKQGQLICRKEEKITSRKTEPKFLLQKWHSNGQLEYEERNNPKKKYTCRRYNEQGQLITKWHRKLNTHFKRLDGCAIIWHEKEKRILYKIRFKLDKVLQYYHYNNSDRVAFKINYSKEDKRVGDVLPEYIAQLLHIEPVCFPDPEPEIYKVVD